MRADPCGLQCKYTRAFAAEVVRTQCLCTFSQSTVFDAGEDVPQKVWVKVRLYLLHLCCLNFEGVAVLHSLYVACQHVVCQELHCAALSFAFMQGRRSVTS